MRHIRRNQTLTALTAGALVVAGIGTASAAMPGKLTAQDFVTQAGATDLMEIKLGKLAEQQSHNSAVQDFAKRMVADHSAFQDKLASTAKDENLNVPDTLPAKMQKKYDQMADLSGPQFDQAYAKFNVKGHTKAVALFKKEAKSSNDKAVSQLAQTGLPTIQEHLAKAKMLMSGVKGKKGGDASQNGESSQS